MNTQIEEVQKSCKRGMNSRRESIYSRAELLVKIADMTDDEINEMFHDIEKLQHHKDSTCGLYAMDHDPKDLLHKFWQRTSDACPLECTEAEVQQDEFNDWMLSQYFQIEF